MKPAPGYGKQTFWRPRLSDLPTPPDGAVADTCPYCLCACWRLTLEPVPLPNGFTVACVDCAWERMANAKELDAARYARESVSV